MDPPAAPPAAEEGELPFEGGDDAPLEGEEWPGRRRDEEEPLYRYWLRVDETQISRKKLPDTFTLGDDSQSVLHEEYTIGREKENTIRLPEVEVSKAHARILRNSIFFRSSYFLVDIGSKNGTFVNGHRLGEGAEQATKDVQPLHDGDRITIGTTTLVFERQPMAPPTKEVAELPRKSMAQLKREYRPTRQERAAQERIKYVDRAASRRVDEDVNVAAAEEDGVVAVPKLPRHNVGYRMLSSMGWQAGTGLGAKGDGRQAPVSTESNRGHTGLGYSNKRGRPGS